MANFEKLYQRVAEQVIQRCHGAIKITKHGKIIEVTGQSKLLNMEK
jgi:DNA/RNA endonuclease YhcR with UshA esterase domain